MARKTQVILTDDIDGTEATQTITYGLDGVTYEIDLNDKNATKLRDSLNDWVSKSRRVGGRARRGTAARNNNTREIREWAQKNGHQLGDRGRIPNEIIEAYNAAH